jgi:hypothetical protein
MVNMYTFNSPFSSIISDKEIFPHLERSLQILSPWMVIIDSDATNQSNSLSFQQMNFLLERSFIIERTMASVAMNRNQFDVAEGHCHRCLVNSKRIGLEGKDRTTCIFHSLEVYTNLRQHQGDFSGAVIFAEEAYNLVVDVYDPVHPQVQEAAVRLIECLLGKGDLLNADRFAEQTYANLRDIKNGIDQEGEIAANVAHNWADVIYQQEDGDLIKAEGLAREAIRIRDKLFAARDGEVSSSRLLLAKILERQGKFGDETKELFERSLAIYTRKEGPDAGNTAATNSAIGRFYYQFAMRQSIVHKKRTQLLLAKLYLDEAVRIESKIHSPTHPNRVAAASLLSAVLIELSRV